MIESIVIMLIVMAVIFMVLSFETGSLVFSVISFVIWLGLSISIYYVEIPYQAIDSSNNIITGTQAIENAWMLSWVFMGLCIIMMLHIIVIVMEIYRGHKPRIM